MSKLKRRDEAKVVEMLPGVIRRTLNEGKHMMVCELTISEGAEVPLHTHPHEQCGYLVSGRMTFWLGEEKLELGPGDTWAVPGGVEHGVLAHSPVVAIDIFSPPRDEYRD